MFIMINQQELLRNLVLIGNHSNDLLVDLLQDKKSFISFDIFTSVFEKNQLDTKYEKSGYDLKPSIYKIGKDIAALASITLIGSVLGLVLILLNLVLKKFFLRTIFMRVLNFFMIAFPFRYLIE